MNFQLLSLNVKLIEDDLHKKNRILLITFYALF